MLCPGYLEMRRIVVSRPTHQRRPSRSLAAAIRSSRIVEVLRFEDTLRTGPAASVVPERDRCRRLNDAWPLAIPPTALTDPANRLRIRFRVPGAERPLVEPPPELSCKTQAKLRRWPALSVLSPHVPPVETVRTRKRTAGCERVRLQPTLAEPWLDGRSNINVSLYKGDSRP